MDSNWEDGIAEDYPAPLAEVEDCTTLNDGAVQGDAHSPQIMEVASPEVPVGNTPNSSPSTAEKPPQTTRLGKVVEPDSRPHLSIVFIGHVDAGKSTTCGNILYLSGYVDERTLEKYEREAKEKNRESWFFAFILDTNEEERSKGKTVEVGRASFATKNRRFTLLDAPGHKGFIPNMITGVAQADVGVLIISARKGEFETGFEKGGQTREHALLAKTLGVNQLVVVVNKMDDPTCCWSESRFNEIEKKLTPFLKSCGYMPGRDLTFLPISGLLAQNLKEHVSNPSSKNYEKLGSWYDLSKPTFFEVLDNLSPPARSASDVLRVPLLDGYKENGTIALGKVESGTVTTGMNCIIMPNKLKVKIVDIFLDEDEVFYAKPGENVRLKLLGVEEDQISKGHILCNTLNPTPVVTEFTGQFAIVEFLEHRKLMTAGYCCILHAHTAVEEVQIIKLHQSIDKLTKKKKVNPQFVNTPSMVTATLQLNGPICIEEFERLPQLGRFTLRDEGKTIAIGKVLEITSP